jgi:hypothetical protein
MTGALGSIPTLEELNVCYNDIGATGATALAGVLSTNATLRFLDVSFNHIGDAGAIALARALHDNHALRSLNAGRNDIGDGGCLTMAEMVRINTQSADLRSVPRRRGRGVPCIGTGVTPQPHPPGSPGERRRELRRTRL